MYQPMENLRNKRSVSVDSGLQREKVVVYEDRRQPPPTILESDEMDVSEPESVQQRKRRKPKGGAEGDECDSAKNTKAKRSGKADCVGSRIRGRAAIHN